MAKPVRCAACGEMVGLHQRLFVYGAKWYGKCPGVGKHPKPERSEKLRFFGLFNEVSNRWPETRWVSHWCEWSGGPDHKRKDGGILHKIALFLAPGHKLYNARTNKWGFS